MTEVMGAGTFFDRYNDKKYFRFSQKEMEAPQNWKRIAQMLHVPEELELMAVYRLGYLPERTHRPAIDWSSRERKSPSQFVFRETCASPQQGWDDDVRPGSA